MSICCAVNVFGLTMLPGCMVGPKYSRPETAADTEEGYYYAGKHGQDVNDLPEIDRWWKRFGDDTTSELVQRALEQNYDLKAAAARVLQAQAALAESKGRRLPDITYNFLGSRDKRTINFGTGRFSALTTTYSQDFTANYVLDLFGKLKHAERASWEDLLSTKADEQALINTLIASVIRTRVNIATIQRRLNIARAITESRQETLDIVERRYNQGLTSPLDVRLARENLASAKAAEPRIELSLIEAQTGLDTLLGRRPGSSRILPETLPDLPDLEPVPVGLPASLLDRRPDLVAAEAGLRAANERTGVSVAQLYPDLTLTGAYGRTSDRFRDLWISETEVYSAIFRLAQPIFKGGQLRAQVDASKARFAELAANYAGAVLGALKEVEDALIGEELLQAELKETRTTLSEATAAEALARSRYQLGLEKIITVLESERRRRNAENALAILKGQIWTTRVNLFLALGGDWVTEPQQQNE